MKQAQTMKAAKTQAKANTKKSGIALPKNHRAVMASRREAPDSLEFFPTPPWATRALCEHVLELAVPRSDTDKHGAPIVPLSVWEPAAGEGHMTEVLREYFASVYASDVFDYGRGYALGAFVASKIGLVDDMARCPSEPDWVITNPPFSLSEQFVMRGLQVARLGVAILIRSQWLEGIERYQQIFSTVPPTTIAHFVERVPMTKGKWDPEASTATSYIWVVWEKRRGGRTNTVWIPPGQRVALTKPDDVRRFGPDAGDDLFEAKGE